MSKTIFALVVALAFVAGSITTTNFAEAKNNKSLADSFFDIFYDLRQQSIQDQQCPPDQFMTGIAKGIVTCKAALGISGRPN